MSKNEEAGGNPLFTLPYQIRYTAFIDYDPNSPVYSPNNVLELNHTLILCCPFLRIEPDTHLFEPLLGGIEPLFSFIEPLPLFIEPLPYFVLSPSLLLDN